ncbi:glutamyl-tRNA reductase [Glaciecola sp. MH2013]|uniref:glutamyl-tRNA reductase n=1 Tax=Glaciecola sp. MH2013 TaxID=2785524 RepID=UPI00189E5D5E|nr:glutamyl-tRNA reductase [Glaciecola sp. MH2013]MBF7072562.1 glutamyl-tRNA reductase [Glaciecola sp. MH2013]
MTIIALGINHKSAPVELREKVAFSPDKLAQALQSFSVSTNAEQMVILSTCNRTEVYASASAANEAENLRQWLADFHQTNPQMLIEHSYIKQDDDAIEHLMQVACGLDSLILGEPQILGQVKQAYTEAKNAGKINTEFEKLFQSTFSIAKKVRTETDIGANAVSVAFAAVQLAKQIFSRLDKSNVLLVGAGETIELVAKHLIDAQTQTITVANRTLSRAAALAESLDGKAITISQVPEHLANADVVISSTASSLPLIGKGMVATALKQRKHKPMLLIDLAVPRDVEQEVGELDDAYLYTVDDLQNIVEKNVANREVAANQAEQMIKQQVKDYRYWQQHYQNVDLIKNYRENAHKQRDELLQKAIKQVADGAKPEDAMQELAFKLTQSMLHGPTKALQQASKLEQDTQLSLLSNALGLASVEKSETGK